MEIPYDSRNIENKTAGLIVLFMRLVLALMFFSASLATLYPSLWQMSPIVNPAEQWLASGVFFIPAVVYAVLILIGALFLLVGLFTRIVSVVLSILVLAILIEHIYLFRLYNTIRHVLPFLLMLSVIIIFELKNNRFSLDRLLKIHTGFISPQILNSCLILFVRIMLGSIFFVQGMNSTFQIGLVSFTNKIYLGNALTSSFLPKPLLWIAGVTNPPLQLLTGIALIIGLFTRQAAILICVFLVTIVLGHMIYDPFDNQAMHAYGLANFFYAIVILYFVPKGNQFSIDELLKRWAQRNKVS